MRWPWTHAAHGEHAEGRRAREDAEQSLRAVHSRWPEVHRVAGSLRELRERNHFAEAIEEAMRRKRP